MCGNSAAAVGTQRQHSYGPLPRGQGGNMVSQHALQQGQSIYMPGINYLQSWVFQNSLNKLIV